MNQEYAECSLCKRKCGVDRRESTKGYCGQNNEVTLASAGIHFGEEPVLTGNGGSGTLFFSGCTMKCPFCQNWQISHGGMGAPIDSHLFFHLCRELIAKGAENINLVTPSHFMPTLLSWISTLRRKGFDYPFLWNSSGFDLPGSLERLTEHVDIFLPDLKTVSPVFSKRYFNTSYYPEIAKEGLLHLAQRKPLVYSPEGMLRQGVIARHLVLPGEIENSKETLQWYAENLKGRTLLSVMMQYTPVYIPGNKVPVPQRFISADEYREISSFIDSMGIENGFIQEPEGNDDEWLPDFSQANPFSSELSQTIWHWEKGFISKRNERRELVHSRMSAGNQRFNTPRLAAE